MLASESAESREMPVRACAQTLAANFQTSRHRLRVQHVFFQSKIEHGARLRCAAGRHAAIDVATVDQAQKRRKPDLRFVLGWRVSTRHWAHDGANCVPGDDRPLQSLSNFTKCPAAVSNHRSLRRAEKLRHGFHDVVAIASGERGKVILRGLRPEARALKARPQQS